MEKKKTVAWGEGRIAFMAHKTEIEARLNDGWPASKIYKELKDKLNGLGYQGFTQNIRSVIRGKSSKTYSSKPAKETPETVQELASSQSNPAPTAAKFFQKPAVVPDQSKLI